MIKGAEFPQVRFTWNISYDCNYRCSYCFFEGKWEEYKKRNVYFSPDEWLQYWKKIYDRYAPPYIVITGGEPFIYPRFIELIKKLSEISYHINISSNSSGDLNKFVEEIDPKKVSLSLSFQPEFDNLDDFIQRLFFIRRYKFDGCVNFVAYPPFLKDIESYRARFASIGESVKIIPFFGEYQGENYPEGYTQNERQLIGIDDNWFEKVRKKGSLCPAGQKTALIFPDGKVARCGQIGEGMVLGSFFDPDFKLLDGPLPCEAEHCPCDEGDVMPEDRENSFLVTAEQTLKAKIELESKSKTHDLNNDIYFTWDIHYKCNFRCPYCWFYTGWTVASKRNIYLSPEEWIMHWKKVYDKYGSVHIEITGGEPFIYPNFIELVRLLSSMHTLKITTNMSGDIESFVKEIDPKKVNLDLNFHPLFANIDILIKKAILLKKAGFRAGVCYLAYPPQMRKIEIFKKRFEDVGINFALAAFWGEYGGKRYPESYTQKEVEYIRPFLGDIDRVVYHLKGGSPKGKLCNAGYKYAVIQADGNVIRCGQLPDRIISNLAEGDFHLLDKPEPCEADFCPCNEYINLLDETVIDDKFQ